MLCALLGADRLFRLELENWMTRADKIKYLNGYRWAVENIKMLSERLATLNSKLYNVDSPVITDMPRGGVGLDTADLLSDKLNIEQELLERLEYGLDLKSEVVKLIRTVNDPKLRMILEMKYLDFMNIGEIASRLGYSSNHISRLHNEAIDSLNWIEEKMAS